MRFSLERLSKTSPALVCAAGVFLLAGCGPADSGKAAKPPKPPAHGKMQPSKPKAAADEGPKLALTQKGVTLRWVENGTLRMSATAKEFQGNELTKKGELIGFSGQLYENGKPATTMTAPKVVADTENRIVIATGGVVMKSLSRKTVIRSQWAKWYEKKQKVVGDGGVTVKSDTWTAEAAAFVADTGLKTVSLRDSTKGL